MNRRFVGSVELRHSDAEICRRKGMYFRVRGSGIFVKGQSPGEYWAMAIGDSSINVFEVTILA